MTSIFARISRRTETSDSSKIANTDVLVNKKVAVNTITLGKNDFHLVPLREDQRLVLLDDDQSDVALTSSLKDFGEEFIPVTVVQWVNKNDRFTDDDLTEIGADFAARDDVWNGDFLRVIVFQAPQKPVVEVDLDTITVVTQSVTVMIPEGPYMVQTTTGQIYAVSKLFEDSCQAFIGGSLKPCACSGSFEWMHDEGRIAVPSRLYYQPTVSSPLAGLRFAVKDIIDVAGLETGCGNRNYRDFSTPQTSSAPCVQQLLDAGAILIGKTRTTQFAEGQAASQWVDYLAPFNPRGDGYQQPSSSSTGSAVACAAYTWLDFSVGTDTGGSIRHPAGVCGTYGVRPSLDAVSVKGVLSVAPLLDTVGLFARSAATLETAVKRMVVPAPTLLAPPVSRNKYKLLYPIHTQNNNSYRWFPCPGEVGEATKADAQFEQTIQKLERHLECTRTVFDLEQLWKTTRPEGQSENLDEATGNIYTTLTTYTIVREVMNPFIASYKATQSRKSPFIDPIVKARHDHGRQITASQFAAAVKSAKMFSKWVCNVLFATSDAQAEIPLLIFPQSRGRPDYRDTLAEELLVFSTFSTYSLSYLSGCPDATVPVGEVPYHSRITDREEMLPISLSVLSPPGTDLRLLALLAELEMCGILSPVLAGTSMYDQNHRKQ